jgi:tetratricopeptide (TPR) repeat protein
MQYKKKHTGEEMKKIGSALVLIVLFASAIFAGKADYGTDSVFGTGTGARALSMGGAFSALADDSSAVFWNPAGLTHLERQELSFMHYPLYMSTLYNSVTYGQPFLDFGTIGAAFYRLHTDGIKSYTASDFAAGELAYDEYRATLSYAKQISSRVSGGASFNVYNMSLNKVSASGYGLDVGFMYEPYDFVRFGAGVRNFLKPSLQMQDQREELPQAYVAGVLLKTGNPQLGLNLTADAVKGEDYGFRYYAGAEASLLTVLRVRAGYGDDRINFGGGITAFGFSLDYAYSVDDYLGGLSRFSATYSFGMSADDQKKAREDELKEQVKQLVTLEFGKKEIERAKVCYAKAKECYTTGKYEAALDQLDRAFAWKKDYREAVSLSKIINEKLLDQYYQNALNFYNRKDYISALEGFKKVAKIDINHGNTKIYLESISEKLKVKMGARQYFALGLEQFINRHYSEAAALFEKANRADSESATIKAYLDKSKKRLREEGASGGLSADRQDSVRKLYQAGLKKYTEGSLELAVADWVEALKIDPDDIKVLKSIEKAQAELAELNKRGIK